MGLSCYPSAMIPFAGLSTSIDVDDIIVNNDFALARRIDRAFSTADIKEFPDGSCIVKEDSTLLDDFFERIPFLSMTMLRSSFPIEFARFIGCRDSWNGGIVFPWKYRGLKGINPNSYLMVYKARNLHNQPVQYKRRFVNQTEAKKNQDYYEQLKDDIVMNAFTNMTLYSGIGGISLRHSPTPMNYWHFELVLKNREGEIIKNAKQESKVNMKTTFVNYVWDQYLKKHFWVNNNPINEEIPLSFFFDKHTCAPIRRIAKTITRALFTLCPIVKEYSM